MDLADAELNEVIDDGTGGPGLTANVHHVVHRQTGFNRRLVLRRDQYQILIEEEVAHHADA